jgi:MtN3 and saliva related transmembrane protein
MAAPAAVCIRGVAEGGIDFAHLPGVSPGFGVEAIGWLSSALLVVTLVHQVRKQWKSGHSEGVSRWLFVGQLAASGGFVVYSALVRNWVFVVTNALLIVNALVGYAIVRQHRKGEKKRARPSFPRTHSAPASE